MMDAAGCSNAKSHLPQQKHNLTYIAVVILAFTFLLIAIRQVGAYNLKIWQIMLGGALAGS